jgi:hypothetical protein
MQPQQYAQHPIQMQPQQFMSPQGMPPQQYAQHPVQMQPQQYALQQGMPPQGYCDHPMGASGAVKPQRPPQPQQLGGAEQYSPPLHLPHSLGRQQ